MENFHAITGNKMELITEGKLPEHEHEGQLDYMPDWWIVFADTCRMFAQHNISTIEGQFDRRNIDGDKLKKETSSRLQYMHLWMDAAMKFHERFGRDYERDKYRVNRPNYYDQHQFYLSTLTQMLVQTYHSEEVKTHHEWEDDGAFIYVEIQE